MAQIMGWPQFKPFLEGTVGDFADFFIGFVKRFVAGGREDAALAGSGTLVAAGRAKAVLTAEHVLRNLPHTGTMGFVALTRHGPRVHQFVVHMNRVRKISIGRGRYDAEGPDLGLLVLSQPEVARLEALGKAFYNLSVRRERMLTKPPPKELGAWVLCGAPDEWTRDAHPGRFERVKEFRATCGWGVLAGERESNGYDYLQYEAKYDEGYEGPESYQGCSGGGLWQLLVAERGGTPYVKELLLSGVAYYQREIVDGRRLIECHGRRSVYDVAERVLSQAAE